MSQQIWRRIATISGCVLMPYVVNPEQFRDRVDRSRVARRVRHGCHTVSLAGCQGFTRVERIIEPRDQLFPVPDWHNDRRQRFQSIHLHYPQESPGNRQNRTLQGVVENFGIHKLLPY